MLRRPGLKLYDHTFETGASILSNASHFVGSWKWCKIQVVLSWAHHSSIVNGLYGVVSAFHPHSKGLSKVETDVVPQTSA